jgi:hypothetical protein
MTRKDVAVSLNWQVMITGIADIGNPPTGAKYTATVILPINIIIPNYGPPTMKTAPKDLSVVVKDVLQIRLSTYSDPDVEDKATFNEPDWGDAKTFVTGKYPSYNIAPTNNATDPGIYTVTFSLIDDNPNPKESEYSFKITVLPLPPGKDIVVNGTTKTTVKEARNRTIPSTTLNIKLKSISTSGLAVITFDRPLLVPGNISSIDSNVLDISVIPGRDSDPKYMNI